MLATQRSRTTKLGIHHFDVIDEEMGKNGQLSSHELLEFCWYAASAIRKLGWTWSGTKFCQLIEDMNKPKRMERCLKRFSDEEDFHDVVFSDECSVKMERFMHRCFHEKREP